MNKTQIFRFLLISIIAAIFLSLLSFFCLRVISDSLSFSHRQEYILNVAREFESKTPGEAVSDFNKNHANQRGMHNQYWIVNAQGSILASTSNSEFPIEWKETSKPETAHEFTSIYQGFSLNPEITIVRLAGEPAVYLVSRGTPRGPPVKIIFAQVALTFIIVLIALFLALSITFIYLQRKSREAKEVLSRLEKGDLAARFKIQSFDEAGSLLLDFNRMAEQIEFLVHKVQSTERTRRELLQELGHDLRTPLTSLSTSLETLEAHDDRITKADRAELLSLMRGELAYFIQLLEDLFFISEIDEPDYRSKLESIHLTDILNSELKAREKISSNKLKWELRTHAADAKEANDTNETNNANDTNDVKFVGDRQSVLRLIKNLLDNASRFASSKVLISVKSQDGGILIEVYDDGPGMTADEIANFGERRRQRNLLSGKNFKASLGLGSVIIKKIVGLYDGKVQITSEGRGTRIAVFLKALV